MEAKFNREKLILPITILLACAILGGFLYATQISKQKSIERQESLRLENETKKEQQEKQTRQTCDDESRTKAKELLKKKAQIYPNNEEYKKGIDQGLYLKEDFAIAYEQCLSKNGLQK